MERKIWILIGLISNLIIGFFLSAVIAVIWEDLADISIECFSLNFGYAIFSVVYLYLLYFYILKEDFQGIELKIKLTAYMTLLNQIVDKKNIFLIAGPCVIESKDICFEIAEKLAAITTELNVPFIFKASYKKANRSKLDSFTTIGEEKALQVLADIKFHFNIPVLTDVHETTDCNKVKDIADIIQIPAFLCRQTDLLLAAGKTGKIINIKKGQFANAHIMQLAAEKILSTGNKNIMLTERGTMFGYHDLIVDFRNIQLMKQTGFPVIFDATHSVQQPNKSEGISGGKPEFIETLAKCAIAAGVNGIFLETHPDPKMALSDGANMLALSEVRNLLEKLVKIKKSI